MIKCSGAHKPLVSGSRRFEGVRALDLMGWLSCLFQCGIKESDPASGLLEVVLATVVRKILRQREHPDHTALGNDGSCTTHSINAPGHACRVDAPSRLHGHVLFAVDSER